MTTSWSWTETVKPFTVAYIFWLCDQFVCDIKDLLKKDLKNITAGVAYKKKFQRYFQSIVDTERYKGHFLIPFPIEENDRKSL